MKKTLIFLFTILSIVVLTLGVFAADNNSNMRIFTAQDLIDAYNAGRIAPTNLVVSEVLDDTGHYFRATATADTKHILAWTLNEEIAPDFDVMVISFRTNYTDTTSSSKKLGVDFSIDDTFNYQKRYFDLSFDRKDIPVKDGMIKGDATFTPLINRFTGSGVTAIKYIKINPYNGKAFVLADGETATSLWHDIKYIAMFKTSADAEKFDYDAYYAKISENLTRYTITYLDRDGAKIAEEKALEGANYSLATAPEIKYYIFKGWAYPDGTFAEKNLNITADITLKAVYEYDEELVLKTEREEAIKTGTKHTDKPFIAGYDGFEFRPDNNMTRAEACTVVTRLLVDENTLDNSKSTAFTDLNPNAWYYKYVTYLESIGYLKSYSGEFKPDQKITRAEFVELVYNMGKISGGTKNVSFKDVPASHPRYEVIMAAAKAGLVNGKSAETFDPDGDIKRSEVVKVLCIALGRVPNTRTFDDVVVAGFSDVSDKHWAFPYIIESAYEHTAVNDKKGEEIWLTVTDNNDYYSVVPNGLIDKLNETFATRVEEIRNTKSEWTVAPGGTVWYFSNSEGLSTNDGKSPSSPIKSLTKLQRMQNDGTIKAGDVVLFKRGDEWHDQLVTKNGVTYSAYGEGPKPIISPSVVAEKTTDWLETDASDVYKYKSSLKSKKDVANIVFNDGDAYGQRVVMDPADNTKTYTAGSDFMVSNGINVWYQPIREFHGYKTLAEIASETAEADLMFYYDRAMGELYLYSRTGNPADRFNTIDIVTYGHGIKIDRGNDSTNIDVTIDNLCIKYAGSHGISAGGTKNLTVRNCEVGWIGGAHQSPDDLESIARYGNAIEVYGVADGFYVYNNYVYECFDCGPTIQWTGDLAEGEKKIAKNIEFYSNVVWEGSLEVWFTTSKPATEDKYALLENCRLYDNLVTGSGYGWKAYNHYKFEWTSFYGGGQTNAIYKDCYIENNYFWGIKRHLMKAVPTTTVNGNGFTWRNNTIIHPDKEGSIGYMGADVANGKGKKTQYFYDKDTINTLVKNGALGLNKFYYTPGDAANRRDIIDF